MGFGDILLILAIALVLFGPEELPGIARKIGKVVFEIRKATNEITKEFQGTINTPSNVLNKVLEPSPTRITEKESQAPVSSIQENSPNDGELLTYEDDISNHNNLAKTKPDDPLAELPSDMVSYEEKGASR